MLAAHPSSAIVAVTDPERARHFYEIVLGLDLIGGADGPVLQFRTGNTQLVVYPSAFAGTNKANAVVWGVGADFDEIVATLKARGVVFEHYDTMPREGDVHGAGDMKLVWFKDPDGNILHINNM
jgi:catechol 2,3-dioxygenase-like lactoylglutathione lyase family enzyme